ncbi:hypothetical protein HY970_00665 [Candidatus Kaiserbacteria bacterium]|nr:hypothetical protein [Candidatus Kaiserbacteria bacterium]
MRALKIAVLSLALIAPAAGSAQTAKNPCAPSCRAIQTPEAEKINKDMHGYIAVTVILELPATKDKPLKGGTYVIAMRMPPDSVRQDRDGMRIIVFDADFNHKKDGRFYPGGSIWFELKTVIPEGESFPQGTLVLPEKAVERFPYAWTVLQVSNLTLNGHWEKTEGGYILSFRPAF